MDNYEVIVLLSILRDEMKHQEDSKIIHNTITDLLERDTTAVKIKHKVFL